jgi:hypothetical protein
MANKDEIFAKDSIQFHGNKQWNKLSVNKRQKFLF